MSIVVDTVNVHIVVENEFFPRTYEVTGGSFDAMKAAIKAAGGQFKGDLRSWLLPGPNGFAILKSLREQYTVTELPLVRVKRHRGRPDRPESTPYDKRPIHTQLWLECRRDATAWRSLPPLPVTIEVTPEMEAIATVELKADGHTPAQIHAHSVGSRCTSHELERMGEQAEAIAQGALKGKQRTKENYLAALGDVLKAFGWVNPQD